MESSRLVGGKMLRRGYTTGSCAAAGTKACVEMLLSQSSLSTVSLLTPNKTRLTLDVLEPRFDKGMATCAIQKDSGDDPDVTNGILIYTQVELIDSGIEIVGGLGVGKVTKPGLDQPVGNHAINSTPRLMIKEACKEVALEYGYEGGFLVTISAPKGLELARRTFNPKMGIEGGISILGTSGIVEPMSDSALVNTIKAELSLLYEEGHRNLLFTIGNYGEAFAKDELGLSMVSHVKCSNYIGESLSLAVEKGFKKVILVGHIGKLIKLSIGITNTHSNYGDGRIEALLGSALEAGADLSLLKEIYGSVSTDGVIELLDNVNLMDKSMEIVKRKIQDTLDRKIADHLELAFVSFSGMGENAKVCIKSDRFEEIVEEFK